MARRRRSGNLRYLILAVFISALLWGIARGSSSVERGYDVPVAFEGLPEELVITDQTSDEVNVRVVGTRAALRNLDPAALEYTINVSGAKVGDTVHEVDTTQLALPRNVRIVSRAPAQIVVEFERRGRKRVRVRADLVGEPPPGYRLGGVVVEPDAVWLTGARSRVVRMSDVATEVIDVSALQQPVEREVKLSLRDRVWREEEGPVVVRIAIEPEAPPAEEIEEPAGEETG